MLDNVFLGRFEKFDFSLVSPAATESDVVMSLSGFGVVNSRSVIIIESNINHSCW